MLNINVDIRMFSARVYMFWHLERVFENVVLY